MNLSTGEHFSDGGEKAVFAYCTKLKTVRLPESLRKIGHYAFFNCAALTHVDIPAVVREIGKWAFCECSSLETATVPEGIVNLRKAVFRECGSLKSVKLPSSLKTIGDHAFFESYALTTINDDALEGVTEIGEYAFAHCKSLATFKLPPLLKTINDHALARCFRLTKVELPPSLETIENLAFFGCSHSDLIIDLPETVTNIGPAALKWCRIRLPTSLSMLRNGGDVRGLLKQVREVVMSSRVNLSLFVEHINGLPETMSNGKPFLDPDLKFKILYSSSNSTAIPIEQHFPESFFSFDVSTEELKKIHSQSQSLHGKVQSAFTNKLSAYAALLQRKTFDIPKEVLYVLLPFQYGDTLSTPMLNDIVSEVGKIIGKASNTFVAAASNVPTDNKISEKMESGRDKVAIADASCGQPEAL